MSFGQRDGRSLEIFSFKMLFDLSKIQFPIVEISHCAEIIF